jgi:enterochelin esterase-like enzyme
VVCDTLLDVNRVSDQGIVAGAFHLEKLLAEDSLLTPLHLDDGTTLFVWRGRADGVELVTWVAGFSQPTGFRRLGGSDVWVNTFRLPTTAMIEYRLAVHRHDRTTEIADPLNPVQTTNPFGTNSLATGPSYRPPDWTIRRPDSPEGRLIEIRVRSSVWGERRHYSMYLPHLHQCQRPYPLVIVHDGPDFIAHSRLRTVLDNLIHAGVIPPVVALLHHPRRRLNEYANHPGHGAHLAGELLPQVARRLEVDFTRCVLVGSSLGATAALSAAWHHPGVFSGLGLLSGPFANRVDAFYTEELFEPIVDLVGDVDVDRRLAGVSAYVSAGRYERLVDLNRALVPRLRAVGLRVRYEEVWEGHQWSSWRDRLGPALIHSLR